MPIGLLIGWLIGQLIVGLLLRSANTNFLKTKDRHDQLIQQFSWMIGCALIFTASFALIGTFIELIVR